MAKTYQFANTAISQGLLDKLNQLAKGQERTKSEVIRHLIATAAYDAGLGCDHEITQKILIVDRVGEDIVDTQEVTRCIICGKGIHTYKPAPIKETE